MDATDTEGVLAVLHAERQRWREDERDAVLLEMDVIEMLGAVTMGWSSTVAMLLDGKIDEARFYLRELAVECVVLLEQADAALGGLADVYHEDDEPEASGA